MLSVEILKKDLENRLNDNNVGICFKLFSDTGKYKKAIRKVNQIEDYVNGIVNVTSSDISKTNDGFIVATMTLRTEFVVRCKDEEEDIYYKTQQLKDDEFVEVENKEAGNETFLKNVRGFLDSFTENNSYYVLSDEMKTTYDISVAHSVAVPGIRQQVPGVGDAMTYVLYSYYNIIQGGENSQKYKFILDGVQIPYTRATLRRVPTVEADVYMNSNGTAKTTISNTVLGYSLACPTFVGEFSNSVKNYILNGENNVAHFLEVVMNDISKIYLVVFGETSLTAQGILNVGQELSFAEAPEDYDLITFPKDFKVYEYTGNGKNIILELEENTYILSTADYKPKIAVLSNDKYSVELVVNNGCYIVSTKEIANDNLRKL